MFTGRFERLLDNKGRIVVPPPLRRHLPDHCFVGAPANERCVQIFTPEQVQEIIMQTMRDIATVGDMSIAMQGQMPTAAPQGMPV